MVFSFPFSGLKALPWEARGRWRGAASGVGPPGLGAPSLFRPGPRTAPAGSPEVDGAGNPRAGRHFVSDLGGFPQSPHQPDCGQGSTRIAGTAALSGYEM